VAGGHGMVIVPCGDRRIDSPPDLCLLRGMSRAGSPRIRHRFAWWRAAVAAACAYALMLQACLAAYTGAAHAALPPGILCATTGDGGPHAPPQDLPPLEDHAGHAGPCCILAGSGSIPLHGLVPSHAAFGGPRPCLAPAAGPEGRAAPSPVCARPPVGSRAPPPAC
jgi:hypothetical protein